MGKQTGALLLILAVVVTALYFTLTRAPRQGLDLLGGTQLTLQAIPTKEIPKITPEVLAGVEAVIRQRIDGLGVSEPLVQISTSDQVYIQLPGVQDPDRAIDILGDTARLEFRRQRVGTEIPRDPQTGAAIAGPNPEFIFESVGLTGDLLRRAYPQAPQGGVGAWEVGIEFKPQGGELFAQITRDLAGTGRSIGIFLDETLISAPTVGPEFAASGITGGSAVITGGFTVEGATDLAVKLQAGSLPVPIKVVENRTVGATLGAESIRKSLYAGIGGLILVFLYMWFYYRLPGLIADISLLIYALCTFALFNVLGVTLTLPGIAGFILSIGMAVDANVLIFERLREELQQGKSLYKSVTEGFDRAFSSIFDGNITTLFACGVLFWLGQGLIKGFAVTLALGILVSFFTALTCTRTFLFTAIAIPMFRRLDLYGVQLERK